MNEGLYHVVLVNDRTGSRLQLTGYPEPHEKACNFRRACTTNHVQSHKELRLILEEVK